MSTFPFVAATITFSWFEGRSQNDLTRFYQPQLHIQDRLIIFQIERRPFKPLSVASRRDGFISIPCSFPEPLLSETCWHISRDVESFLYCEEVEDEHWKTYNVICKIFGTSLNNYEKMSAALINSFPFSSIVSYIRYSQSISKLSLSIRKPPAGSYKWKISCWILERGDQGNFECMLWMYRGWDWQDVSCLQVSKLEE